MHEWEYSYVVPSERNIARRASAAYGTAYDAASEAALNRLGAAGWELIEVRPEDDMHILKRPKRVEGEMEEWEYLCPVISVAGTVNGPAPMTDELAAETIDPHDAALQAALNRLGTAGWELVGIRHAYNTWVMKRPKRGAGPSQP
jgi:hypothetical protein